MRRKINYVLVWLIFCAVLLWLIRFLYFSFEASGKVDDFLLGAFRLMCGMFYMIATLHAAKLLYEEGYQIGKEE